MQTGQIVLFKKAFTKSGHITMEDSSKRGHSFVCVMIDAVKDGEEGSTDPVAALNEIGWFFDPSKVKTKSGS